MSLRHAILGILEWQPMHGYQVKQVLEQGVSRFWPVKLAAIYPSLRRLEEEGFVTHHPEPGEEGRPDRKVYTLTDAGESELASWRRLPPDGRTESKIPLFLKLFFAKHENAWEAVGWLETELREVEASIALLQTEIANPELSTLFVDFMRESGLAHQKLQLELVTDLRDRLRAGLIQQGLSKEPAPTNEV